MGGMPKHVNGGEYHFRRGLEGEIMCRNVGVGVLSVNTCC
jgi:hypothetical protein